MHTHELSSWLDDLTRRVATYGIGRHEQELAQVAEIAQRWNAAPAVAYLVADRTAPDALRVRALARVTAALRAGADGRPVQPRRAAPRSLRPVQAGRPPEPALAPTTIGTGTERRSARRLRLGRRRQAA